MIRLFILILILGGWQWLRTHPDSEAARYINEQVAYVKSQFEDSKQAAQKSVEDAKQAAREGVDSAKRQVDELKR